MTTIEDMSLLQYTSLLSIIVVSILISIYYQSTNFNHIRFRLTHTLLTYKYRLWSRSNDNNDQTSFEYKAFKTLMERLEIFSLNLTADPLDVAKEFRKKYQFSDILPRSMRCHIKKKQYTFDNRLVNGYWIDDSDEERQTPTANIILYFHGGAYIAGDMRGYCGYECHLSNLFNISVYHLEYRRAPEYRLPVIVDDALILYKALLNEDARINQKLIVMGDSAGGGLSLLLIQQIVKQQLPIPRGIILLSPWADLSLTGESNKRYPDLMFVYNYLVWSVKQATGNEDLNKNTDPLVSPVFGSFKNFPPMYLSVGTAELSESDALAIYKKAKQQNVNVQIEIGQNLMHTYPIFYLYYPEAQQTLNNIKRWIEKILLD
ncbi:unnamed protein product [Didymodactylos carnosus]|uniref:Alpha/beta hydrolase fold-3 domain-containing protein n=1 Tax=Didymodactylos carnosus TaxID=1234261 RepID=A0A8S2E6V6_9BILA|nr:unnamed protein product [Didymodactylos carnosus]CAF3830444.1 unnamed protein product [Didymodactylos carnosus]